VGQKGPVSLKPSLRPAAAAAGAIATSVTVHVDAAAPGQEVKPFWIDVVGSCHGPLWAERWSDMSAQLAHVRRRLGAREVRFHNILSCVPKPENGNYDFSAVDRVYDAITSAGVRPLVEVSFMPPWLASGGLTIFEYKANVTPPRDVAEWKALVKAFAQHLMARYGREEVRKWRFEIWNEPDLDNFWSGSREDYYSLYVASVQALHEADPALLVGGPSSALNTVDRGDLVGWFLDRTKQDSTRVDFVTWHLYGGWALDREADKYQIRGLDDLRQRLDEVDALCRARNLPLLVTEWNSTPHPHDRIHDETLNAAFALNLVRTARGKCDAFSYWVFSDIFAEQGVPASELSGGFGLLSLHGLEKPVFKAFEMLNLTRGGRWLAPDEGPNAQTLASWDQRNRRLVLLLWNWPYDHAGITTEMPALARDVEVRVDGLPKGKWRGTIYRLDATRANLTAAWRAMGGPAAPSPEQTAQLRNAAQLRPEALESRPNLARGAALTWRVLLAPGDCCALVLTPKGPAAQPEDWARYE
jgi:xylan 1,4-beta-xylosidase